MLRYKAVIGEYFRNDPNVLYNESHVCVAHGLHNSIKRCMREGDVVGHGHAVAFVFGLHSRRKALCKALAQLVDRELECFPGPAPREYVEHAQEVVSHTIIRHRAITRAARTGEDFEEARNSET